MLEYVNREMESGWKNEEKGRKADKMWMNYEDGYKTHVYPKPGLDQSQE